MRTLILLARSMRPQQWAKNVIVFAALAFSENLFEHTMVMLTLFTFGLFCLVSSAVYILNDIMDREADRHHPEKKNRPIASGELLLRARRSCRGLVGGSYYLHYTSCLHNQ
jgi:4-hydroxybenzoate polyprenyltransferase